ncbi:MAG TPA: BTAD domain-containing putative transcriptional regulator [Solirubrobacteraceae bacterium]|nr:BTAD domain-containing putative transcriptional regulator [Solirubrobacteraceae bacterium]
MEVALSLLEDVRWRGRSVAGDRPRTLLAALAAGGGRPVRAEELIELVWGEEAPANATKSLQVLVSRTRSACGADAIVRDGVGYRLGVAPTEVDSVRLAALVRGARAALERDAASSVALAREALALSNGDPPTSAALAGDDAGPLHNIREAAAADVASARVILAHALSRTGAHADALPALEAAHAERPDDESLLADLLRTEGVVRGPAAALERFENYRRDVRERLGTNPGEQLQRAHQHLLALDQPVRSGVRYDASTLVGRERDLERLRALMAGSRVVSIVGPGGLGKTRLAHVLAREAAVPIVHVVELVGVTSAEDIVGEVGSALGVRDSVSGRRVLTPEQRADVRARVAQQLGQAPSLLVLDNCEHLIGGVAELVAFLVSTTADLRVLTTSRAPLAIASERVYLLGQLEVSDAAQLFCERALAARATVRLAEDVVVSIVTQLDGLPLAIELAAAKVRAMSVEEIDRRLENRFALLRGGDRSAPDRHQTLLAVIDWSWNLLDDGERRALARLALFHDGFTLEAAREVLGADAVEAVQGLVDQSLLSVRETRAGLRYQMLETVREFGRMQLVDAGQDAEAQDAQRRWASAYARRQGARLPTREQLSAIDALGAEEVNLADELRGAIAVGDIAALVQLLAALGMFWAIRGEHGRLIVLARGVADAVRDWRPPPELEDVTRAAMTILLSNAMIAGDERIGPIREMVQRLGLGSGGDPRLAGSVKVMMAFDPADGEGFMRRLDELAADPERYTALPASQWLSHARENVGDPAGAVEAASRALALVTDEDGPWSAAILHTQLAQLQMHLGHPRQASDHARAALPVMRRLGATDDEVQLRSLLGLCAIAEGRLDDAQGELAQIDEIDNSGSIFGGVTVRKIGQAELALARGENATGLRLYRESAASMRELQLPGIPRTGLEPWSLFGDSTALTAHAYLASDTDAAHGRELFCSCRDHALRTLDRGNALLDYPVAGMVMFALGAWGLLRRAMPADHALRLLVLADRFAYNRSIPTMAWERIIPHAEESIPGRIAALSAEYGDDRPPDLLVQARRAVEGTGD